jgi:hypothetical protein
LNKEYILLENMADDYHTVMFRHERYQLNRTDEDRDELSAAVEAARITHGRVVDERAQLHAGKSLQQLIGSATDPAANPDRALWDAFENINRDNAEAQTAEWNKPGNSAKWMNAYGVHKPIVFKFIPPQI